MKTCRLAIVTLLCCAVIISTFSGCADSSLMKQADIKLSVSTLTDDAIILDAPTTIDPAFQATAKDIEILNTMTLTLENDHLQFYLGKFYDIAVLDKKTGSVYFSNEDAYFQNDSWSEQRVANSRSQLTIEYYGSKNSYFSETSYPHCLDNDGNYQVTTNTSDQKTTVTYQFGEPVDSKVFCRAMTKEAFESLEELAQPFIDSGELTSFEWRKFKGFYSEINYDTLNDYDKSKYEESHPNIVKIKDIYVMQHGLSETQKNQISKVSELLGINNEFIQEQVEIIGYVNEDENVTAFFEIPVVYELHGSDLVVSVDLKNVKDTDDFKLTKIHLLNGFCATPQNSDGYIFLPDGSGAIIENDVHNDYFNKYEFPFYGSDYGIDILDASDIRPESIFPVFGIKTEKTSVFAVVESGDAIGGVSAQIGNSDLVYNTASAWFTYYEQDRLYLNGLTSKDSSSYSFVYSEKPNTDICRVRYHFLYGDNATYSGMASYYKKYLTQTGALVEKKIADNLTLDLNFVGAIQKTESFLGVPVDTNVAASDFDSIESFLNKLSADSDIDYNVTFKGALNGGMDFTVANTAELEDVMGDESVYNNFKNNFNSSNKKLSFAVDLFRVHQAGNGLDTNDHLAKYLTKQYVYTSDYAPPDYLKTAENQVYLTAPLFYKTLANNFLTDYSNLECKQLHVDSIGSMLYGDYTGANPVSRTESKAIVTQVLKQVKDSGYEISVGTGNIYTIKYIDRLTEIPVTTSSHALESYPVPFAGMILHSYVDYSGPQLNQQGNYKNALLQNIRSGAGLNYLLMTSDPLMLEDTKYSNLFSVHADKWLDEIVSTYSDLNEHLGELQKHTIVKDEKLSTNVYCTTYSNGKSVIVNFNSHSVETKYGIVDGLGYFVA